jgi:hypothetical protein
MAWVGEPPLPAPQTNGELVKAIPENGLAVLNADDPRVAASASRAAAPVKTFGRGLNARRRDWMPSTRTPAPDRGERSLGALRVPKPNPSRGSRVDPDVLRPVVGLFAWCGVVVDVRVSLADPLVDLDA